MTINFRLSISLCTLLLCLSKETYSLDTLDSDLAVPKSFSASQDPDFLTAAKTPLPLPCPIPFSEKEIYQAACQSTHPTTGKMTDDELENLPKTSKEEYQQLMLLLDRLKSTIKRANTSNSRLTFSKKTKKCLIVYLRT